jgi:hypothetical protein
MHRLFAIGLMLGNLASPAPAALAQSFQPYNPYRQPYNNWNNNFSGYQDGSREYRRQIREMNPYRDSYNQIRRQNRSSGFGY